MLTPTHTTPTNRKPAHCVECHKRIGIGQGRQMHGTNQYLCDGCATLAADVDLYIGKIAARIGSRLDAASAMLTFERIIRDAGQSAALVLQAVDDRTGWMETVTRRDVATIANEEFKSMGIDALVW